MTVEIADIRTGIAANLQAAIPDCQVNPYPSSAPTPPALIVQGFDRITKTGFGTRIGAGSFEIAFLVQGIAGMPTNKGAHIRLDKWLSPYGGLNVWQAIGSDPTLGGKVAQAYVTECDGYQLITIAPGVEMLGSTWHLTIEL